VRIAGGTSKSATHPRLRVRPGSAKKVEHDADALFRAADNRAATVRRR
jgi:hypothetical protein